MIAMTICDLTESCIGGPPIGFLVVIGAVMLVAYLLPSMIAILRGHPWRGTILILNIFFGWTLLGWVVLLAWAFGPAYRYYERDRR